MGSAIRWKDIEKFREYVEKCELLDMKYNGATFTWNNKQEGGDRVFSKIDKTLVNLTWVKLFPGTKTSFLPEGLYDHCPALVKFFNYSNPSYKPFRYFNMWSQFPNFLVRIRQSWLEPAYGIPMYCLMTKLKCLKPVLKAINKEKFSNIERRVDEVKQILVGIQLNLQANPQDAQLLNEEIQMAKELRQAQNAKTSFLRQKKQIALAKG